MEKWLVTHHLVLLKTNSSTVNLGTITTRKNRKKSSRVRIQGSRKMGCLAHITIKKCTLYLDYSLQPDEGGKSMIRTLKEKKMAALKANLCKNAQNVTTKTMYYVSLPTEDSHQGHPTGAGTICTEGQ